MGHDNNDSEPKSTVGEPAHRRLMSRPRPMVVVEDDLLDREEFHFLKQLCPASFWEGGHVAYEWGEVDIRIRSTPKYSNHHTIYLQQQRGYSGSGELVRVGQADAPHFEQGIVQLTSAVGRMMKLGQKVPLPSNPQQRTAKEGDLLLGGSPLYDLSERNGFWRLNLSLLADTRIWVRCFLDFLHDRDPSSVPKPMPRIAAPEDWFTQSERDLAQEIEPLEIAVTKARSDLDQKRLELVAASEQADEHKRTVLFADGDDLVNGVIELLAQIGFGVVNVDEDLEPSEPKREDLRITHSALPHWIAIAEVKGYTNGPKTNDLNQIRNQRERYLQREGELPSDTWWIINPYRQLDPSSRQPANHDAHEKAKLVGARIVEVRDLYRLAHADPTSRPTEQDILGLELE